jgi:hypothetical protein
MQPISEQVTRILDLLAQAPLRLEKATRGVPPERLYHRSGTEPWSVSDILAHLRACPDVWSASLLAMLTQDNPSRRYASPRTWMKKPKYADPAFAAALAAFTQEREKLLKTLAGLDESGWARPGTFSGVSQRQRHQTVLSYADRIVSHEQPHLEQIESLLG